MPEVVGQPLATRGRRDEIDHHLADHLNHGSVGPLCMKHGPRQRVKQHYEWNEGNDGVRRYAEGKGVHLTVKQIGDEHFAFATPAVPFGWGGIVLDEAASKPVRRLYLLRRLRMVADRCAGCRSGSTGI